jgi:hypothetical protein
VLKLEIIIDPVYVLICILLFPFLCFRSQAMQLLTLDQLCTLLKFSLARMKAVVGVSIYSLLNNTYLFKIIIILEILYNKADSNIFLLCCQQADPFLKAVDPTEFPRYSEYVVNAMDMSQLEKNVRRKQYGSTEAFLADTKWIHHNSVIFNTCKFLLFVNIQFYLIY